MQSTGDDVVLTTSRLAVTVARKDGAITYRDLDGKQLVQEASRKLTPVRVNGEDAYRAESFINIYGSARAFTDWASTRPGFGTIVASRWIFPRTIRTSRCRCWFEQRLRHLLEQRFTQPVQQPLRKLPLHQFRSGRRHRLLLLLRPRFGQGHCRLPRTDRAGAMFGKWAYGFWQCKNRYRSQEEILEIARKYRELHIPADNIVQDWFWWNRKGEHVFNKNLS